MKSIISFLSLCITFSFLISQPILNQSNNTNSIGSQVAFTPCDTVGFQPGAAGVNATWSFPNLISSPAANVSFKSPANTMGGSQFTGANIATETGTSGNIDRAFYLEDNMGRYFVGAISAAGSVIEYTDFQQLISYPFTYNDMYTDNFLGSSANGGVTQTRIGTATVEADGYGTLTTPAGTFNNVIRIKTVMTYRDTSSLLGDLATYDETRWEWFSTISATQLMVHSRLAITVFGFVSTINSVTYHDLSGMSLAEEQGRNVNYLLVPSSQNGTIDLLVDLNTPTNVTVKLFNLSSQMISESTLSVLGKQRYKLDLPILGTGIYFFKIEDQQGQMITQKWVVR